MQCVVHINVVKQSPGSIMRLEVSLLFSEYTFVMLVQVLWSKELKFEFRTMLNGIQEMKCYSFKVINHHYVLISQ